MIFCSNCGKPNPEFRNAYGESLCEDCWDEYMNSDCGKVEYFLNIVKGEEEMNAFDADHLGSIVNSWKTYKHLLALTEKEIKNFEATASLLSLM